MAGPRKPSVPVTAIVFRGGGRGTHMIVEPLPEAKEDLELAIVERFLNGLRAQGRDIGRPERGPDPPDAVVQIDGARVGIEVVEVIDPEHAQRRAIPEQYLRALLPLLQDLEAQLEGVAMTVVDGYQEPMWPSVASNQGRRLVQFLCQKIRAAIGELLTSRCPAGFTKNGLASRTHGSVWGSWQCVAGGSREHQWWAWTSTSPERSRSVWKS